jgi:succinyl-diaminopimelate desuccinylase
MDKTRLAAAFEPERGAMIAAVNRLCAIPSVKGVPEPGAPFGAATREALEAFLEIGRELGFAAVDLDGYCGYLEWGKGEPLTAVLGHLDVVPAVDGWTHDPFIPVVTEDRIIARGTADDKGPLVSALFALKSLRDEGFEPRGRIRLIAGLDEESGSACMKHYAAVAELPQQGFTPDASFPVIHAEKGIAHLTLNLSGLQTLQESEPGRSVLVAASAGQRANMVPARCELTVMDAAGLSQSLVFTGTAAHASTPWEGQNAIGVAMAAAAESGIRHPWVDFYQRCIGIGWDGSGLQLAGEDASGPLTVNPGILQLDREKAALTLDIRYPASWAFGDLLQRLESTVSADGMTVEVQSHTPPLALSQDHPLVQTLMHVYNLLTGEESEAIAIGGGTYARSIPNIVAFGPTFPGEPDVCHQVDEFITFDKLMAAATLYREALRELTR